MDLNGPYGLAFLVTALEFAPAEQHRTLTGKSRAFTSRILRVRFLAWPGAGAQAGKRDQGFKDVQHGQSD